MALLKIMSWSSTMVDVAIITKQYFYCECLLEAQLPSN